MWDAGPVNTHSWRLPEDWTLPVSMLSHGRSRLRSAKPATEALRRGSLSGTLSSCLILARNSTHCLTAVCFTSSTMKIVAASLRHSTPSCQPALATICSASAIGSQAPRVPVECASRRSERRSGHQDWRVDAIDAVTMDTNMDAIGVSAWRASVTRV